MLHNFQYRVINKGGQMQALFKLGSTFLNASRKLDFIAPLLLRLYLTPIFWMAGINKLNSFDATVAWFGNKDWGLGLPFPELMVFLATWTEIIGAILLLPGLAVSWIAIPLMITMLVAVITVHWQNGWLAIAEGGGFFANERTVGAIEKLDKAKEILQQHGHYNWLTENGSYVVLNNGIEFSATYFIMLLVLFFSGGGRFISVDYWYLLYLKNKNKNSLTIHW
ncbi:MAG: DoxX family protein [Methylococcales bacterium]|nr:DoxX family protein [Methylococcales bacterium]